jgi:hypothetical protein
VNWKRDYGRNPGGMRPRMAFIILPIPQFFHHLLHLCVLFQKTIDVLDLDAGAGSNPSLARSVDNAGETTLSGGHGINDGNLTPKLLLADRGVDSRGNIHRQLVHQGTEPSHLLHLYQLLPQIRQIESLSGLELAGQAIRLAPIYLPLHLLDQGQDVAHS